MMGLILIGVGLAVPDPLTAIAVALVFGTAVNPFLFVPLAFNCEVEKRPWYRLLAVVSFIGVSAGLVAAAIVGPGRAPPSGRDSNLLLTGLGKKSASRSGSANLSGPPAAQIRSRSCQPSRCRN